MDSMDTLSLPRVDFDLNLQVSPYAVYRRITDGEDVQLVDLRRQDLRRQAVGGTPPGDVDVVFFDEDGKEALERVRELRRQGHARVWALFGGAELWEFALDAPLGTTPP